LGSTLKVLEKRLAKLGLKSGAVETDAANRGRFVVTLPAGSDVERIKDLLTYVGKLELRPAVHGTDRLYTDRKSADWDARDHSRGMECEVVEFHEVFAVKDVDPKQTDSRGWMVLERRTLIGNEDIVKADAVVRYGGHLVEFTLSPEAAYRFGEWTATHVGDTLAIVLDGVVKSAPTIQGKIADKGQISGHFDQRGTEDLAFTLESGALPVPLRVLSEERLPERE
jgi:protein-export membrane protein SecD